MHFDGADDQVKIPTLNAERSLPVTIEAYVRADSQSTHRQYVLDWAGIWLEQNRTHWTGGIYTPQQEVVVAVADQAIDSGEQMTHLALVVEESSIALYVNGRRQNRPPESANQVLPGNYAYQVIPPTLGLFIGTTSNQREFFKGDISQVRVSNIARYSRDFTPDAQLPADQHTLALYRFDLNNGNTLHDGSGNGHHGEIIGAKWNAQGVHPGLTNPTVDSALEFASNETGLAYVETPIVDDGSSPLTMEFWATHIPGIKGRMHGKLVTNESDRDGFGIAFGPEKRSVWQLAFTGSSGEHIVGLEAGGKSFQRTHFAVVRGGTHWALFVNGQKQGEIPVGSLAEVTSQSKLTIGGSPFKDHWAFKGTIDEARISRSVRYTEGFTPATRFDPDADTIALYDFTEGSGDILHDRSGHGHDGKIVGATWVVADEQQPLPSDAAVMRSQSLIPMLAREHVADGSWDDLTVKGENAVIDVSHRRHQFWHDFPQVHGNNLRIRTGLSIPTSAGYAKVTFIAPGHPDYNCLITSVDGRNLVWIESSEGAAPLTPRVEWSPDGQLSRMLACEVRGGKLRVLIDGNVAASTPVPPDVNWTAALAIGGWRAELTSPTVEFLGQSPPPAVEPPAGM
ncbi:MAG: LamG-like jellyroll fold domain-containing protein [Planctomycetaceae bacterium]